VVGQRTSRRLLFPTVSDGKTHLRVGIETIGAGVRGEGNRDNERLNTFLLRELESKTIRVAEKKERGRGLWTMRRFELYPFSKFIIFSEYWESRARMIFSTNQRGGEKKKTRARNRRMPRLREVPGGASD